MNEVTSTYHVYLFLIPKYLSFVILSLFKLLSELGDGWGLAIIDSPVELIMIREIQKKMDDDNSYWTGGSTNAREHDSVTYFDYYQNNSTGKHNNTFIIMTP